MELSDEQRNALLRLRKACAEVQEALDLLLEEAAPSAEPGPFAPLALFREKAVKAGVDPADLRFAEIAPERFPKLPEDKQRRLVGDCLRFLDKLLWKYLFLLPDELRREGRTCMSGIVAEMDLKHEPTEVAEGTGTPASDAFATAARTLAKEKPGGWAATLEELMKLWDKLAHSDGEQELLLIRYATNTLQPTGSRGVNSLVEFLASGGIREIPAQEGALFDDSYSPGRYERRRVRSDQPRDCIVEVHQRGFLGADGIPLQRAIVSVSDGQG